MNLSWLISYAYAAKYNLIQPLPGVKAVESFPEYIQSILPFILSLAAVLAVVMIVVGGVEYAVSLSEEGKKNARGRINNAILGLLLALVSYLILYTINPDLTKLKLDIQNLPNSGTQQPPTTGTQPPQTTTPPPNVIPPPTSSFQPRCVANLETCQAAGGTGQGTPITCQAATGNLCGGATSFCCIK